jgi:YVTN family beta-propeller protein
VAALAACARRKGTRYEGYAFVANEDGQAIAAVDLSTFTVARYIHLDGSPTAVVAPAGHPSIYALTPATGCVHEISAAKLAVHRRVQVARVADSVRVAPGAHPALWVSCRQPRQLVRVSLDAMKAEASIPLPFEPYDFDLAPDGETAVVSFGESGQFGIADLVKRKCRVFDLGRKLSLARFRSDGRQLLIAAAEEPLLSIVDFKTGRVVVDLPLAVRARNFCFKSDGGQLFITGDGMDAVVVVYPYTTEVAETVLAGRAPGFIAECASEDGDYLFVANPESGETTILDLDSRKVVAVVAVGRGPGFIAETPDRQYALVLNRDSGDMAVVRLAAVGGKRDRSAPLFTMIPVGSKPVCATVRHV